MATVMEDPAKIQLGDLEVLMEYFVANKYKSMGSCLVTDQILAKCQHLIGEDYNYMIVPNYEGELCDTYPNRLIIPESEIMPEGLDSPGHGCPLTFPLPSPTSLGSPSFLAGGSDPSSSAMSGGARASINGHHFELHSQRIASLPADGNQTMVEGTVDIQSNGQRLRDLILKAKSARCRTRFPVPTILYNGKYICRSATISGGLEIYGRYAIEYLVASGSDTADNDDVVTRTDGSWEEFDRVRSHDIRLLRTYNVREIVDLMMEKKKVKLGLYVSSSEKVDKEKRYREFRISSLPYPGCEFFTGIRNNGYSAENLLYKWDEPFVNADLDVPESIISHKVSSDWNDYQKWNLLELTRTYLKLLITYAHDGSKGILVHCISGWDRTPLFISLLRLSLWADGLIHKSLDYNKILYLTIAYDWMAFGHQLQNRLCKGEEVFFFCFDFLKYITSDEFSVETLGSFAASDYESWNNGSREPPRATSPIDIGVLHGKHAPRTRNDSVGSTESWQFVAETGSPRGSTGSFGNRDSANYLGSRSSVESTDLLDSATTVTEGSCESDQSIMLFTRAEKLQKVRDTFYKLYATKIGFKDANGRQESGLGSLVNNIAEMVGMNPVMFQDGSPF